MLGSGANIGMVLLNPGEKFLPQRGLAGRASSFGGSLQGCGGDEMDELFRIVEMNEFSGDALIGRTVVVVAQKHRDTGSRNAEQIHRGRFAGAPVEEGALVGDPGVGCRRDERRGSGVVEDA